MERLSRILRLSMRRVGVIWVATVRSLLLEEASSLEVLVSAWTVWQRVMRLLWVGVVRETMCLPICTLCVEKSTRIWVGSLLCLVWLSTRPSLMVLQGRLQSMMLCMLGRPMFLLKVSAEMT